MALLGTARGAARPRGAVAALHPAGPIPEHLLGTDQIGRDLLSRLIWGARTSLLGPLVVVMIAVTIGVPLAVTSAWRGGKVDMLSAVCST